jgi:protein-S-isoprenylcysteine O-methyltransferase Ste14
MAVNEHFETTVRIQHDRDHQVCNKGPYRFVRHPGYSGFLISSLAGPLVLGSWYALIPTAVVMILFVIRTALEDRTLRLELPGYEEYAQKTKYRLVPKVW